MGLVVACVAMTAGVAMAGGGQGSAADPAQKDWVVYGHDLSNTRLNARERRINRRTIAQLTQKWTKNGLIGVSGTPTVSGRIAYFGDWTGTVWAVKAETGQEVWTAKIGGNVIGAPAIQGDSVYTSSGSTLYRLDRATGTVLWKVVTNENPFAQINASPVVVDGLVLQGTAQFEEVVGKAPFTFRGTIGAYDAETGREVWRFYTTPNDRTSGAGIGIWSTPAVDTRLGLVYVGTGQNISAPTGPLADSLLAIDYKTGTLRWSRQFTNPDVFGVGHFTGKDADVGASPNLWTSKGRPLVGVGDKAGVYHALDRDTGAVVWETKLTPGSTFGGVLGSSAFVDGKLIVSSNIGDPATNAPTKVASVFALDPASGALVWKAADFTGNIFAPVSAVRGVAFVGTDAGTLAALDTRTGGRLWSHAAPAKTACGPSVVNGRVLWGYGFTLFAGAGDGGVISFGVGR